MREIKFRGRALFNDRHANIKVGDFVYGSFIQSSVDAPSIVWGDGEQAEVDIETVGQYIGKKDKNGKKVYERDICKKKRNKPVVIEFSDCLEDSSGGMIAGFELPSAFTDDLEVVGNIDENPELIEMVTK